MTAHIGPSTTVAADAMWWRGAAIYQVYPRSFYDANNDGIGDLPGITAHLPYIAQLGVDAVWVSPFFSSPMADFGYDVSDYRSVDPIFGRNEDFSALLEKAHDLGLKVLVDLVFSHTSEQHPWFLESRTSRTNPKADWYVWADPKPDGTPPNNWLDRFTHASAWRWEPRRRQYYLHNFLPSQPDLNLHHPAVQEALLAVARYWAEQGVDGFRFDVVNMYMHDLQLRDNPPRGAAQSLDDVGPENPLAMQLQVYNRTRPENLEFIRKLRALMDEFPALTSIAEISDDDNLRVTAEYTHGTDLLHMGYCPFLLRDMPFSAALVAEAVAEIETHFPSSWPMWVTGNHDVKRLATRWQQESPASQQAMLRMMPLLLGGLRGTLLIYQGDELGLPEADVPYELLQDPFGKSGWPEYTGRDGCRTPLPWQAGKENAGFTLAQPWLPVPEAHHALAIDVQDADPASLLNHYRRVLAWRRQHSALRQGTLRLLALALPVLGVTRQLGTEELVLIYNLSVQPVQVPLDALPAYAEVVTGHGLEATAKMAADYLELAPFGFFCGRVVKDDETDA